MGPEVSQTHFRLTLMMDSHRQKLLPRIRRVVIKVGSSILVGSGSHQDRLSEKILSGIVKGISSVQKNQVHVTLVSSGAIASGMHFLGYHKKPSKISELQACAAIGQPILIQKYQKAFAKAGFQVAQILLTWEDLSTPKRLLNAKHTLNALLEKNIIPIINENDTVAVEEIRFGDNDNLAALVTDVVDADLLILLTDQDGFYTADPRQDRRARKISVVEHIDEDIFSRAADAGSAGSVGGMKTKLEAAQKAAGFGLPTIIASGKDPQVLQKIFQGESVGTLFKV